MKTVLVALILAPWVPFVLSGAQVAPTDLTIEFNDGEATVFDDSGGALNPVPVMQFALPAPEELVPEEAPDFADAIFQYALNLPTGSVPAGQETFLVAWFEDQTIWVDWQGNKYTLNAFFGIAFDVEVTVVVPFQLTPPVFETAGP